MKKSCLLAFLLVFCIFNSNANTRYRISILTCSPGNEPYQLFGHTAFRVVDSLTQKDTVFNYGTFEFSDKFLPLFIKGRLNYYLSQEPINNFVSNYINENRWVIERVLDLDSTSATSLSKALFWNSQLEHRYYLYDFMNNNCCTKPRDLLDKIGVQWNVKTNSKETYRTSVDAYVHNEWMDFGIDLLLGQSVDKSINNVASMFLPENLDNNIMKATLQNKPLVKESITLFQNRPLIVRTKLNPSLVFWLLLTCILLLQITNKGKKILSITSYLVLMVTGVVGWILMFMWFLTDHPYTKNNLNILWAFPLHFPMVVYLMFKNESKFKKAYILLSQIGLFLALIIWLFHIQVFHVAVLPIILILFWAIRRNTKKSL
jgi:hypothetical protein